MTMHLPRARRRCRALPVGVAFATAISLTAACSEVDGDGSSAVIVTTTSTATPTTPTTDAPGSTIAAPTPMTSPPEEQRDTTAPPASTAPPTTTPATVPATTTTTTTTPPVVGDPVIAAEPVGEFEAPVGIAVRPNDSALYVIEQAGRIVRFDAASGHRSVVTDIAGQVSFQGERGLLGLAFSSDGSLAYVDYTDNDGDTNIVEYAIAPDGTFDTAGSRLLLEVDQPYANHNGGDLAIGPDGMLYIALGDGGSGGDPERRASDPRSLLGSLLRIDPAPSPSAPYTIPPGNPFASGAYEGNEGAPEVWSWGLRNPWRFDFDPVTGDLWIADVGQNRLEEVNRVAPTADHPAGRGLNFGWSAFEGTDRFNADVPDPGNLTFPVLTYQHGDDGCSVSGGAVYRGDAIAGLEPAYLYSDYCSGTLWALDLAGQRNLTLLDQFDQVASVDRGPDGELYVIERTGPIWKLVPA